MTKQDRTALIVLPIAIFIGLGLAFAGSQGGVSVFKIPLFAFVVGLVAASFGVASALTTLSLPDWTSTTTYYLTLKFIPRDLRNLLFIVGGVIICATALIQLNKIVLRAFAHTDEGDLAGIMRTPSPNNKLASNNKKDYHLEPRERDQTQVHTDLYR